MKKILLAILPALLAISCSEEAPDLQLVQMEDPYVITDDPTDPVKHRVYEIYQQYGVPVYFNDTIARINLGINAKGEPYYGYETLDLGWNFDAYEQLTYMFDYITEPSAQMDMLDNVEYYLSISSEALWPHAFFLVDKITTVSRDGKFTVSTPSSQHMFNFRVITLIRNNWSGDPRVIMEGLKRSYVANKISLYATEVEEFGQYSKDYYGLRWENIHENIGTKLIPMYPGASSTLGNYVGTMNGVNIEAILGTEYSWVYDCDVTRSLSIGSLLDWVFGNSADIESSIYGVTPYTDEEKAILWPLAHYACGVFGYVSGNRTNAARLYAPRDASEDMLGYLTVLLNKDPDEFREEWSAFPMVLEKYEIIYDLVVNKLGVEL